MVVSVNAVHEIGGVRVHVWNDGRREGEVLGGSGWLKCGFGPCYMGQEK